MQNAPQNTPEPACMRQPDPPPSLHPPPDLYFNQLHDAGVEALVAVKDAPALTSLTLAQTSTPSNSPQAPPLIEIIGLRS